MCLDSLAFFLFLNNPIASIIQVLVFQSSPVDNQQAVRIVLCPRYVLYFAHSDDGAFHIPRTALDQLSPIIGKLPLMLIELDGVTDDGTDSR